jgi:hypothetical protein
MKRWRKSGKSLKSTTNMLKILSWLTLRKWRWHLIKSNSQKGKVPLSLKGSLKTKFNKTRLVSTQSRWRDQLLEDQLGLKVPSQLGLERNFLSRRSQNKDNSISVLSFKTSNRQASQGLRLSSPLSLNPIKPNNSHAWFRMSTSLGRPHRSKNTPGNCRFKRPTPPRDRGNLK